MLHTTSESERRFPRIWFVLRRWTSDQLNAVRAAKTETDLWNLVRYSTGRDRWIASTYFYLHNHFPLMQIDVAGDSHSDGISVLHYDDVSFRVVHPSHFIVVVQPDRATDHYGHVRVVQNRRIASDDHVFIPFWPQPDLWRREPDRGDRFERLGFLGTVNNCAPCLRSEVFLNELRKLGLTFVMRDEWRDYRDLDAVVAVRDLTPWDAQRKPASKLVNSWMAGVVPILGQEPTFWDIGRPGEDYLEVADAHDVLDVVAYLRDDVALRRRLLLTGAARARSYTAGRIAVEWRQILLGPVLEKYVRWRNAPPVLREVRNYSRFVSSAFKQRKSRKIYRKLI